MGEETSLSTILPAEARPPTPPRESDSINLRTSFLGRIVSKETSSRRSSSSHLTPPDSSIEFHSASGSIRKRVGWAASAEYNEPPVLSFDGARLAHSVPRLPPSAERKPAKSILKAYNASQDGEHSLGSTSKLLPPHQHPNFATMLDSIVQQLAGGDRTSKIDAYLMLSSSLKASENVPDIKALRNKLSTICGMIYQDIDSKDDLGKGDSTLTVNALTLLASFLQKGAISDSLPSDFQISVVEFTIKGFADGSISKEIMRHLMFILAQQSFSSKVMNQDRVSRLINALHDVEIHVKGKSVVMGRLQSYRNLLRRSKTHMLANTVWMADLFVDMSSNIKDVRTAAITFGMEASLQLGAELGAARALTDLFKVDHSDGKSFAEFYAGILKNMLRRRDDGSAVPQIWSIVILFMRAKPALYEQWKYMKLFVDVLTQCWNSGDHSIRSEANIAWNRFVFAVQPTEKTSKSTIHLLFQPIAKQIAQRKTQTGRKSALNSAYHLLYYALNPNAPTVRLDVYWDAWIEPLMNDNMITNNVLEESQYAASDMEEACLILRCLFDTSRQRPWSENRLIENPQQTKMDVKELPALDAKWLRSQVKRVSPILSSLLLKLYWDLGQDESPITRLWKTYVATIALPARMEVKVSNDTMNCIASLFGTLHKIWTLGRLNIPISPQSKVYGASSTPAFLESFEKIVTTTIDALGSHVFTEKLLSISKNEFIAVATPSHEPRKVQLGIKCPLNHLLLLLMSASPDLEYNSHFAGMIRRILLPIFEARQSSISKKDFIKDLFNLLPVENTPSTLLIWEVLAGFAAIATDQRDDKQVGKFNAEPPGPSYRETLKILEAGCRHSPSFLPPGWKVLFEALVTSAILDAGEAGASVAIIEPLAALLTPTETCPTGLDYLHALLAKAYYPKDRQTLNIVRKRMWGSANSTQKPPTFDPFTVLYKYIRIALETSYSSFSKTNVIIYVDIIKDLSDLLSRCPKLLLSTALAKIQNGVALWISDSQSYICGDNDLSRALLAMWLAIVDYIRQVLQTQQHTEVIIQLESLLCCGLNSKHKTIVSSSIQLWNATFGSCNERLEYPDQLKAALTRLHPIADILLPFFPDSLEDVASADQAQRVDFADTQDESTIYPGISSTDSFLKLRPLNPQDSEQISPTTRRLRQTTPQVIIPSLRSSTLRKRTREPTPNIRERPLKKRDTTPRARHDDSQVEFEAVPSSPLTDRVAESQLLTEKQKETRERQFLDAAMFPDLRSSPRMRDIPTKAPREDPELPQHGSRSRSRSLRPSDAPRQTTPTLVIPSDDDQFFPSSPTPTRPVRGVAQNLDPPSSPPESAVKRKRDLDVSSSLLSHHNIGDDTGLVISEYPAICTAKDGSPVHEEESSALSSSRKTDGVDGDQSPRYPSAQVNPIEYTISHTSSIWGSTAEVLRASTPIDGPSDQLLADAQQHDANDLRANTPAVIQFSASTESGVGDFGANEIEHAQIFDAANDPKLSSTPTRNRHSSPLKERSPQYVDAPTSPSISDPLEEFFEDAVSSPSPLVRERNEKNSSPLSDIDETSMLRIMADYDEGSGRTTKQVVFMEQQAAELHPPTSDLALAEAASAAQKSALERNSTAQEQHNPNKEILIISPQIQTSSVPSIIPETPGPVTVPSMLYYDDDGVEIDISQSIIVDISCYENNQLTVKRRAGRSPNKKRKYQEIVENHIEALVSQDAESEGEGTTHIHHAKLVKLTPAVSLSQSKESPSKYSSPAKKKRGRGRPKGASKVGLTVESSFEEEASQENSQLEPESAAAASPLLQKENIVSVEIETAEINNNAPDQPDQIEFSDQLSGKSGQVETTCEGIPQTAAAKESGDVEMSRDQAIPDTNEVHAVEQTESGEPVVEASRAISTRSRDHNQEEVMPDSPTELVPAETSATEEVHNVGEVNSSQSAPAIGKGTEEITIPEAKAVVEDQGIQKKVQEQPGVAARMIESVKNRLRSVIGDLNILGLGRRDTRELEDLFMDAKRALYDAESRGRGSAD